MNFPPIITDNCLFGKSLNQIPRIPLKIQENSQLSMTLEEKKMTKEIEKLSKKSHEIFSKY